MCLPAPTTNVAVRMAVVDLVQKEKMESQLLTISVFLAYGIVARGRFSVDGLGDCRQATTLRKVIIIVTRSPRGQWIITLAAAIGGAGLVASFLD